MRRQIRKVENRVQIFNVHVTIPRTCFVVVGCGVEGRQDLAADHMCFLAQVEVFFHKKNTVFLGESSILWSNPQKGFLAVSLVTLLLDSIDLEFECIADDVAMIENLLTTFKKRLGELIFNTPTSAHEDKSCQSNRLVVLDFGGDNVVDISHIDDCVIQRWWF